MATTTNFNDWIDNLSEQDIDDIYNLYESVRQTTDMGGFKTTQNEREQKFVTSDFNEYTLMLANDRAETAFLNVLDYRFGGDFGWVGGHWDFVRNMRKDD